MGMQSKPFVIRYGDIAPESFAKQFLASDDFDVQALKGICLDLGLKISGDKNTLLNKIERQLVNNANKSSGEIVLQNLIKRNKKWFTFKMGQVKKFPILADPTEIVFATGKPAWYGPILVEEVNWYLRPYYANHWEVATESSKPEQYQIRWLCFARVTQDVVSLHWQGFTLAQEVSFIEHEGQFPYWNYVPRFFDEIQKILNAQLAQPILHNLVLYDLWDKFRLNKDYEWEDLRIRAESGGVSLSAKSAGRNVNGERDDELDIKGIKHLAKTLCLSTLKELNIFPANEELQFRLEESILRTLIREFGAKSYEFSLKDKQQNLLRAHFYFGMKPNAPGPDSFPHVNCYIGWRNDSDQLKFILQHLKPENVESKPEQSSFFK
jgi:hypothetical protein